VKFYLRVWDSSLAGSSPVNGIGAFIVPRRWVDSWWAWKGPLTREDLENTGLKYKYKPAQV
jgi:hypothetical protein